MTRPSVRPAPSREEPIHDLLGVGCGPANLALAVALEEEAERAGGTDLARLFLEARPEPCWHPGMLLEGSLIQIAVLKDLVTVRNPQSRFTFLSYLKDRGRLFEFLNLRDLFPTRYEFNDYLCWVADRLGETIRFGYAVETVRPAQGVPGTEPGEVLEVIARDAATGGTKRFLARNVVVATGGRPTFPDGLEVRPGGRVLHPQEFARRIGEVAPDEAGSYRFVVVGSGQSGAELFYHLATRYPRSEVTATVRRFGYKPVDESDFTNEVFFPDMVDFFYGLPEDRREMVVDSFRDVNYAVVDHPLIKKIYRFLYDERVRGRDRVRLLPYLELRKVEEDDERVRLELEHKVHGERVTLDCDAAVLCTGYEWAREEHPVLAELADSVERDGRGRWAVERDYRLVTRPELSAGVYLQGYAEDTHGISETVLSLLPIRAQEIVDSVLERRGGSKEAARERASEGGAIVRAALGGGHG